MAYDTGQVSGKQTESKEGTEEEIQLKSDETEDVQGKLKEQGRREAGWRQQRGWRGRELWNVGPRGQWVCWRSYKLMWCNVTIYRWWNEYLNPSPLFCSSSSPSPLLLPLFFLNFPDPSDGVLDQGVLPCRLPAKWAGPTTPFVGSVLGHFG